MSASGGFLAVTAIRLLCTAASKTTKSLYSKASTARAAVSRGFHVGRQPLHPTAFLRQARRSAKSTSHGFVSSLRRYISTGSIRGAADGTTASAQFDRSHFLDSRTARFVSQFTGRAPFASILRPNLTGGAIPRTASGYSLGGGSVRYFSHGPAAPAEVVHQVSSAMRAFFLSGQRAQFDGVDLQGRLQYRAVPAQQQAVIKKTTSVPAFAPGSYIDFCLAPTLASVAPIASAAADMSAGAAHKTEMSSFATLHADGVLDELSVDIGRILKDLSAILGDLQKLAALGDLPIVLEDASTLRVRFPGVDADSLERLCNDIGLRMGTVHEDPAFGAPETDALAPDPAPDPIVGVGYGLRFPFAPELSAPSGPASSFSLSSQAQSSSLNSSDLAQAFFDRENEWVSNLELDKSEGSMVLVSATRLM